MTLEEIKQLRAYTWYDGIYLTVIWVASFACFIGFIHTYESSVGTLFSTGWMFLAMITPFFVGYRLKKYRDEGLGGHINYGRAFSYCLRVFMNAAILFAVCQYLYMRFLDHGNLQHFLFNMITAPGMKELLQQMGIQQQEMVASTNSYTPVSFALSYLINNTIMGGFMSLFIAIFLKRK